MAESQAPVLVLLSHPEVYIRAADFQDRRNLQCFHTKPIFSLPLVYATPSSAVSVAMGAHHMFATGPSFPSAIFRDVSDRGAGQGSVFNWIGTMWKGSETPIFIFGGLHGHLA